MHILQRKLHGFSLIEIIFVGGISSILLTLCIGLLSFCISNLNKENYRVDEIIKVKETVRFIQSELNYSNISIETNNNTLICTRNNGEYHKIRLKNLGNSKNIVMDYYDSKGKLCTDNVLKNVSNFIIEKMDGIIYIEIEFDGEKTYKGCAEIKN